MSLLMITSEALEVLILLANGEVSDWHLDYQVWKAKEQKKGDHWSKLRNFARRGL